MQIFSNRVHMNINFRYASIIDTKINFLAQVIKGNIQFFFGIVTFGPPCICLIATKTRGMTFALV
jgi:hypothetical protein